MSASPVSFLAEFTVLVQPLSKTILYWAWYSTLLWIPVRLMAALIDRRKLRVEEVAEEVGGAETYRIGKPILPPM